MAKHIPQRTCIACRAVRGKRDLIRIVRTQDDHLVPDATGKKAGRGAYLCRQRICWDLVLEQRGRLEHALRLERPPDAQDLDLLRQFAATLPPQLDPNAAPQAITE